MLRFRQTSPLYDTKRCHAFVCDLANDALDPPIAPGSMDVIVMIFVLSAIRPDAMPSVMQKLFAVCRHKGWNGPM